MFQTIQGSAHDIAQVADRSVQLIATSPPYYGLRAYDGEQAIEWPTVEYAPMPGLPPIRVQGCEPGCVHEWADGTTTKIGRNDGGRDIGGRGGNYQDDGPHKAQTTQGAYCIHCGGWRGGLGLEPDPFAYIGHLILCLREWRRVLRDDGLCFVNLGDSYNGSGGAHAPGHANPGLSKSASRNGHERPARVDLPAKNLMQIPQRFALAAQADGWFVRNDIIWSKPNPMPESVQDRFTRSHEYIYMLAKSERYFFDAEAVKESAASTEEKYIVEGKRYRENGKHRATQHGGDESRFSGSYTGYRNRRTVWELATRPFGAAHFACFPPEIPEICIRAGTSARGCCPACGAPWRRVVEREGNPKASRGRFDSDYRNNTNGTQPQRSGSGSGALTPKTITTGWEPTCTCNAGEPTPCVVLDPFSGSGTTLKVAVRLGRRAIGVDLSEKYLTEITEARMGAGVQMELTW